MDMELKSPAFGAGEAIPRKFTGEGEDVSPPLAWSGAPRDTRAFALVCDDPDAPTDEPWVHWVVYDIPADRTSLPEGAEGFLEGKNSWGRAEYGGPLPPAGHGEHRYRFHLYALDRPTDLEPGATLDEVRRASEDHVLAEGELVGLYERRS